MLSANNLFKLIQHKNFLFFYWIFILLLNTILHYQYKINFDEGVVLNNAWHLLNGYTMYSDIFSYIAPGSSYLIAGLWKITGINYSSAIFFTILILVLNSFLLYKSAEIIRKSRINLIIPLIFTIGLAWLPLINHNFYSTSLLIYSTYFFLKYLNNKKNYNLILTGIFIGLSIFFLQQKGLAVAGATFLFLLFQKAFTREKLKKLVLYSFSVLAPLTIFLAWPLSLIYNNLIYFPWLNYTEINQVSWQLYIIVILIFIATTFAFRREKKKK